MADKMDAVTALGKVLLDIDHEMARFQPRLEVAEEYKDKAKRAAAALAKYGFTLTPISPEKAPDPVIKAVERVLDENSAWIARPNKDVTFRVALAATLVSWDAFEHTDNERAVLERAVDRMGWDEINAFREEMERGQGVREDAGGYFMRAIRRLFGLPQGDPVETYREAARRLIEEHYTPPHPIDGGGQGPSGLRRQEYPRMHRPSHSCHHRARERVSDGEARAD